MALLSTGLPLSPIDPGPLLDASGPLADLGAFVREGLRSGEGPLPYLLVFLGAATPWLEILVVVPIAIAYGLHPVAVAIAAFLGNALAVYALLGAVDRVTAAVRRWRARRGEDVDEPSARRERAERLWNRYGMPGLAIASPVLTGVHLAAVLAVGLGATRRSTTVWMTASLAVWTVVITLLAVAGVEALSVLDV